MIILAIITNNINQVIHLMIETDDSPISIKLLKDETLVLSSEQVSFSMINLSNSGYIDINTIN